ncbi:hypothetical protein GFV16_13600 [Bacillus megaterium]|nr:hypothetical protein [Priestia megaterium]
MLHDFEEIITVEKWAKKKRQTLIYRTNGLGARFGNFGI